MTSCASSSTANHFTGHSNHQQPYTSAGHTYTPASVCYNGDITLPAFHCSLSSPLLSSASSNLYESGLGQDSLYMNNAIDTLSCDANLFEMDPLPDLSNYLDASSPWSVSTSSSGSLYSTPSTSAEDLSIYDTQFDVSPLEFF